MPDQARHVFVDASGRRQRRLRALGWGAAVLLTAYLVLLGAALVGPPGLARLAVPGLGSVLPETGAAVLGTEDDEESLEDALSQLPVPTGRPQRATPEPATTTPPGRGATPARTPTGTPVATASPSTSRPGSAPATPPGQVEPTATTEPTRGGKPTDQPTQQQPTRRATGKPSKSPPA